MKCPNCTAEINGTTCEYCGTQVQSTVNPSTQQPINIIVNNTNTNTNTNTNINNGRAYLRVSTSPKSKSTAMVLCCLSFMLGGLHRFYVGKKASGIAHLCTFGFFWIGTIIDLVSLSKGEFTDSNGLKLK